MGALDRVFRGRRGVFSQRPLAAQVAALFANGEQGFWNDIEGFRDAWNASGPELLTNGDFSGGVTGWTLGAGYSVSSGILVADSTSNQAATQPVAIVPGRWYMVSLTIVSYTRGNVRINVGGNVVAVPSAAALGVRQLAVQAGAIDGFFRIYAGDVGVGGASSFDTVSVKEWVGLPLCALYQDAAGTIPAYMPGQGQTDSPVGLVLDRRFGLLRGPERFLEYNVTFSGESSRVSPGVYRCYSSAGAYNMVNLGGSLTVGSWYELQFTIDSVTTVGTGIVLEGVTTQSNTAAWTTVGKKSVIINVNQGYVGLKRSAAVATDYQISGVSIREIKGSHAYQPTTTSRPVLSARYNLCIKTQDFSDVSAWGNSVSGTGSTPVRTANFAVAPDGTSTATRLRLALNGGATASDKSGVYQNIFGGTAGASYTGRIWLKATNPEDVGKSILFRHAAGNTYQVCTLTADWKEFVRTESAAGTTAILLLELRGASGGASDSIDLLVWGADFRHSADGVGLPSYQRVVDANTYEISGFPLHLVTDGVDDFYLTANLDFSGSDKILVVLAMRKASDAVAAVPLELSPVYTNPGAFALIAPVSNASSTIAFVSKGATSSITAADSTAVAPISTVSTGYSDIGGKVAILRTNGLVKATTFVDQGGGNYGSYPLYIGRRAGTSLPFKGRIYGVLIRSGAANESQINKVERFMNQRGRIY